jgi:predicted transcriptional regulator
MKQAVAFRLSDEAIRILTREAKRRGDSKTRVVEDALRAYAAKK